MKFSEMNKLELLNEIGSLTEKARKAEQMGNISEFAVLDRKISVAKSYLIDATKVKTGEMIPLKFEANTYFFVEEIRGVFAWGYKVPVDGNGRMAIPIDLLIIKEEEAGTKQANKKHKISEN
ncbi:MAG: hypothetical protein K0S34_130 [Bacillales bacterium]|jgi:hypothetical protein|nr:hypothetical protein [Bacillales bacterium]